MALEAAARFGLGNEAGCLLEWHDQASARLPALRTRGPSSLQR